MLYVNLLYQLMRVTIYYIIYWHKYALLYKYARAGKTNLFRTIFAILIFLQMNRICI